MNNSNLRTLAERTAKNITEHPGDFTGSPAARETTEALAVGALRLLDENKRLSEMLADEILGAPSVPAELRTDLPPIAPDVPDGYQEVDLNEED